MTVVALKPKQDRKGLQDVLKTAQKTDTKKSSVPTLEVDQPVRTIAQDWLDLKIAYDDLGSLLDQRGAELTNAVTADRVDYIRQKGFTSSVRVPTNDKRTVTIEWKHSFYKCPPDCEQDIINVIGDDRYDAYFGIANTIKVKDDISTIKLQELIDLVGADQFAEYFEVSSSIKPNERFKLDQYTRFSPEELRALELAGVKQYKPAIKK